MYVAAGHITVDLLDDGRRRAGGTVLFGALAAVLRGERAHIVTTAGDEIEELLPQVEGLTIERTPTPETTTFANRGTDRERVQTVSAWAGLVAERPVPVTTSVLHLGPVACELEPDWLTEAPDDMIVVLTPQGLVREWPQDEGGGPVTHRMIDGTWTRALRRRIVVVLNAGELAWVGDLGERAVAVGGALVVTDGHRPATVRTRGGATEVEPRPLDLADDTGAGDVFAAAIGLALARRTRLVAAVEEGHAAVGELLPQIHALLPVR